MHHSWPRVQYGVCRAAKPKCPDLDGKQVTLDGLGLHLISQAILNVLTDHCVTFAAIGGVSIGADPIVGGMITLGIERGYAFRGFLVRKEPKGHGTNRYIEGPVRPGDKVVIVEDVSTTGASALKAIDRCRDFGLEPLCVISVVDREQGAAKAMPIGVPLVSLLRVSEIMEGMPCESAVI